MTPSPFMGLPAQAGTVTSTGESEIPPRDPLGRPAWKRVGAKVACKGGMEPGGCMDDGPAPPCIATASTKPQRFGGPRRTG